MKYFSVGFLLFAFMLGMTSLPESSLAKNNNNSNGNSMYSDDVEDEMEDELETEDEMEMEDETEDGLEIEADVFTDITVIKVELSDGSKTVFTTNALTEAEVVDVVVAKFDLTADEVLAVLDIEIEDRSSRPNERAKISGVNNHQIKHCVATSVALQVEADVFTNTTIVKVEHNGTSTVFETVAKTSDAIAEAVVSKITTLNVTEVKAVLDLEIEDRTSLPKDLVVSSQNSNDDCKDTKKEKVHSNNGTSSNQINSDSDLRSRIVELQKLLETLIGLFKAQFGSTTQPM